MNFLTRTIFLFFILSICSCVSYEELINFNETTRIPLEPTRIENYKPILIQAHDIIQIRISSTSLSAITPFTLAGSGNDEGPSVGYDEYIVNNQGFIDFPTLGRIQVSGLEVEVVKAQIAEKLSDFFQVSPIVEVRMTNFKVIVNGEVGSPGIFTVNNNKLSIIEAITLAGDFTDFSNRDSILIIREENGFRSFGYISFNSAEVFLSPYFYLQQNDVIYVKPSKAKLATVRDPATKILPWVSAAVSVILLLLALGRN